MPLDWDQPMFQHSQIGLQDLQEACKAHMPERGVPWLTLQALLGVNTPDETHLFGHKPRLKATGS
jgi:maltooligosyltrehalose synthase